MEITGDWGPAVDMQGYGWALLVATEDAWDRFGRSTMARFFLSMPHRKSWVSIPIS